MIRRATVRASGEQSGCWAVAFTFSAGVITIKSNLEATKMSCVLMEIFPM